LTATEQRQSNRELAESVFANLRTLLFSFEEGSRQGDVESIHDMRVTTRRLRVALSNFAVCLPVEVRGRVKEDVNQLALALGRVRDLDVMLESLTAIEEVEPVARRPIIADLRTRLTRRRKYHHQRLVRYFRSEAFAALKSSLAELTDGQAVQGSEDNAS
jgi:CHAD domain-containing protein